MTTDKDFDPRTAIYTPPEWSAFAMAAIKKTQSNATRGLAFPVDGIADYFAPVLPGQLCAIIAQTSNYKSGFMHFWERHAAKKMLETGKVDECIVHVSVEECVEEQAYLFLARETKQDAGKLARGDVQDWRKLEEAVVRVGSIPIYRIGDSIARAEDLPNLYMSNMIRAIQTLVKDWRIHPAALFFDYLQAFPFDPEVRRAAPSDQRRLQVREDIYRLRNAAAYFDCPVVVGVQAKQHLDGAPDGNFQLPGMYDGEESSAIAQRADRIITLWLPKMNHSVGSRVLMDGKEAGFTVRENLMWLKVAKQRGGLPAGKSWPCDIDFTDNSIKVTPRLE